MSSRPKVTVEQRRARLARRHHLARPAAGVEAATEGVLALHSTVASSVYLSAWARTEDLERDDLADAIYERRTLVRMLGMRRTVFVVPVADAPVVDAACTQALLRGERKKLLDLLAEAAVSSSPEVWLADVEAKAMAALEAAGEATAAELGKLVPELAIRLQVARGKKYEGTVGVGTRVLFLLAAAGHVVRGRPVGTWVSSQYRWAPASSWVEGDLAGMEPSVARAALLTRWLQTFGPGSLTDITWWTGWTKGQARAALTDVEAVEVDMEVDDDGTVGAGWLLPDDLGAVRRPGAWVALLPTLDPTTMGWKERAWYLGPHQGELFDTFGNGGPTVWANGRIVGGWGQRADGAVAVELLEDIEPALARKVEGVRVRLDAWLDRQKAMSTFRTPTEKAIAAT